MHDRMNPSWLMTPQQADRIGRAAEGVGMRLDPFVDMVLKTVGDDNSTYYLYHKVLVQADWLTQGLPLERAPHLRSYQLYGANPFRGTPGPDQIDMSIDEFIDVHIPAALARAA